MLITSRPYRGTPICWCGVTDPVDREPMLIDLKMGDAPRSGVPTTTHTPTQHNPCIRDAHARAEPARVAGMHGHPQFFLKFMYIPLIAIWMEDMEYNLHLILSSIIKLAGWPAYLCGYICFEVCINIWEYISVSCKLFRLLRHPKHWKLQ